MWLMTTQGFYSAVAHRDDPDLIVVRARTQADIEALERQIPGLEPFADGGTDYRWRAIVTREQWRDALDQLADAIDYENFKAEVTKLQGHERADLYLEIWTILRSLQAGENRT